MDLRKRAIQLLEEGLSVGEVARRLMVSKRSVERFRQRARSGGSLVADKPGPKPGGGKLASLGFAIERWTRTLAEITVQRA